MNQIRILLRQYSSNNGFLKKERITAPIKIIKGATAVSFNDTNWDVIVVPILAPKVMPTDCPNVIIPAFTKPTSITVVAPDDCINAVNKAPNTTALYLFVVHLFKICHVASVLLPAVNCHSCISYQKETAPDHLVNPLLNSCIV